MSSPGSLEAFAKARNLRFRAGGSLPGHGNLPSRGGRYETTDSDGHSETHTRRFTVVVTAVPQSIDFMPSLGFAGARSEMSGIGGSLEEVVKVDLGDDARMKGSRCFRYKGASELWTRCLLGRIGPVEGGVVRGAPNSASPEKAAPRAGSGRR